MPGAETTIIDEWLYATLTADAQVAAIVGNRVYNTVAPREATFPCIVFQHQASTDVAGVGALRIMVNALYVVRGIVEGRSFHRSLASAIDAAIHRKDAILSGGEVLSCTREEPFSLAEDVDGAEYRHLGGIYRIYVQ